MIEIDEKYYKECLNHIAASDEGKVVFAWLKESCGWDMTVLASSDPQATQYYATRRGVYGGIRKDIRTEHLKDIEFNYKKKAVENERRTSKSRTKRTD